MTFNEVIGQQEVQQRLMKMVDEGRLPHAIMLCGPTGIGKKALAIAFGCYLLSRREERGVRLVCLQMLPQASRNTPC